MGVYKEVTGADIGFLEWMTLGIPAVAILLPIAWLWLTLEDWVRFAWCFPVGSWTVAKRRVLFVFACTAALWMLRTAPFGGWQGGRGFIGCWRQYGCARRSNRVVCGPNGEGEVLLDWDTAKTVPWGLLLLFGGSIAIARAFGASGLSASLGDWIASVSASLPFPTWRLSLILCVFVTFLTEVTSNTATTTLSCPFLQLQRCLPL